MTTPQSRPLVTVVTPTYNAQDTLHETIWSVQAQTFTDWELILVDDASSDDTVKVLQELAGADRRIKYVALTENQGAAVARNIAIEQAQGRFIAFLDSDDYWLPEKLQTQIDFMQRNDVKFSYTSYRKIDADGSRIGAVHVPPRCSYSDALKNNVIGCLTAMYDTDYFGKVYMPLIRKRQDLGLWLLLLKNHGYAQGIQKELACYRIRPNSISSNKYNAAKFTWRLYRDVEGLPLPKAAYYFSAYAINGILKTYVFRK